MVDIHELKQEIIELADIIAAAIEKHQKPAADELTKRQACEMFDRAWVEYHYERGNIKGCRRGKHINSPIIFSRLELLALKEAERRGMQMVRRQIQDSEQKR